MVYLKAALVLALCVLSLQLIPTGYAEIADAPRQLPLLLRPNLRMDPGAVVVVGRYGAQDDVTASTIARLGMQAWLDTATKRIVFVRPDLKLNVAGINGMALKSLRITTVDIENARVTDQGFFLVSVGGPEVNLTTRKINSELPVQFKGSSTGMWTVTAFIQGIPQQYQGSEYGMIAFLPEQSALNRATFSKVAKGQIQLGSLVVAGNGREGTLAAAVVLREILSGRSVEGRKLLYELDKALIWMISGEEQNLHPVVVIVKYAGEDTAEIVDIFLF